MAVAGSDDDRNRTAVRAPRRTRDVAGLVGAEKGDDGGDLVRLREAPEGPSLADGLEHLLLRLAAGLRLLVGEAAFGEPGVRRSRARRHGVAAHAVLRVQVGDEPRE